MTVHGTRARSRLCIRWRRCWRRPGLTGLEVLWRWVLGIPALWLIVFELQASAVRRIRDGTLDVALLGLDKKLLSDPVGAAAADPMGATAKLTHAVGILFPRSAACWRCGWCRCCWWSGWWCRRWGGRWCCGEWMRRLHARPVTLMVLQAAADGGAGGKLCGVVCDVCGGRRMLRWRGRWQRARSRIWCCILRWRLWRTLGLFTLWAVVSWVFSVAPLLAMLRGIGAGQSLRAAWRLGPLKGKLVEINLVMGIVKIALIVLAMVFSACSAAV